MSSNLKKSAAKVQAVLNEFGCKLNVVEFSESPALHRRQQMP